MRRLPLLVGTIGSVLRVLRQVGRASYSKKAESPQIRLPAACQAPRTGDYPWLAMPLFPVTCRGNFDQAVVDALDAASVYWMPGGKPRNHSATRRHRHHLRIEAKGRPEAHLMAETAVSKAGGSASEFEVGGELSS